MGQIKHICVYKAIRDCHKERDYPIDKLCKLLSVSRSAYYKWDSGKTSSRILENDAIAKLVEKIHNECPDKGYRRINDDLKHDYGIYVNDKRILRICRNKSIKSTSVYNVTSES